LKFAPSSLAALLFTSAWVCTLLPGCASTSREPRNAPPPYVPTVDDLQSSFQAELPATTNAGEVVLDDRDGLSPNEAGLMALELNPTLRAARAARGLGEAELLAAGILPNPVLGLSLATPTTGSDADVLGYGLGVSWNIQPLFSRAERRRAAGERLGSIELDIAWREWQTWGAARLAVLRAIGLERRIQLARTIEARWRDTLERRRAALAKGATTALAVGESERSLAEATIARLELESKLASERTRLARAIGLDALAEPRLDMDWRAPLDSASLEDRLAELPTRRLDLVALELAMRAHNSALAAATIDRFPALEIGLETGRGVDGVGSAGLSVRVGLPLFDRNQAAIAAERAGRVSLAAEYAARLASTRSDVVRLAKELELNDAKLEAARTASAAAAQLATQAKDAAARGALDPLLATDLEQRADRAALFDLAVEGTRDELRAALMLAAGRTDSPSTRDTP